MRRRAQNAKRFAEVGKRKIFACRLLSLENLLHHILKVFGARGELFLKKSPAFSAFRLTDN